MGKVGTVVNGGLGLVYAGLVGFLGVAIIAGAGSQGSMIGVLVGIGMLLWAAYRAVNVLWWTNNDINQQRLNQLSGSWPQQPVSANAPAPLSLRSRRLGASFTGEGGQLELAAVDDDSLAARVGLRQGDVLIDIAGVPVVDVAAVQGVLNGRRPDEQVQLGWRRGGQPMSATAQMVAAPMGPSR